MIKNDIIRTTVKHTIYEICIDLLFKMIGKNFPKKGKIIPKIGDRYVRIINKNSDYEEIYYTCTVIDPKSMKEYYDDLTNQEKKSLIFAIHYKKLEYDKDIISENDYEYFGVDEFAYLKLEK